MIKASDLPGPKEYVQRAFEEVGPVDMHEVAHHAAMIAHSVGYNEGYSRGHEWGSWCIRRNALFLWGVIAGAQVVIMIVVIAYVVWR